MLTLFQFAPAWGLLNASQFCMKVEVYLRLAHIPYQVKTISNPNKGPKQKLPFIVDKDKKIGDSSLIITYLKQAYGDSLDQHLTAKQKALALSIQHLLEEHFYWICIYSRWIDPNGWKIAKREFFSDFPPLVRNIIPELLRKNVARNLQYHGIGRHTAAEIYNFGKQDLSAIATLLGEQAFVLGDKPSSLDACVYAFIANVIGTPIESPLKQHAHTLTNLITYQQRMDELTKLD